MFGDHTELDQTGHLTPTVTGFTQTAGGCGCHITHGAGEPVITADGGGILPGDGCGHRVTFGHPHGLYGYSMTGTAAGIQFRPGLGGITVITDGIAIICGFT